MDNTWAFSPPMSKLPCPLLPISACLPYLMPLASSHVILILKIQFMSKTLRFDPDFWKIILQGVFITLVVILIFCSCSSKAQVVESDRVEIRHDTLRQWVLQHDTLTTHDSVITYVREQGDTLILKERIVKYKDRIVMKHDTVFVNQSAMQEAVIEKQPPPDHTLRNRIIIALLAASFIGGSLCSIYKEL